MASANPDQTHNQANKHDLSPVERYILEEAISGALVSNSLIQYHGAGTSLVLTEENVTAAIERLHNLNLLRQVDSHDAAVDYEWGCFAYNRSPHLVELAKEVASGLGNLARKLFGQDSKAEK